MHHGSDGATHGRGIDHEDDRSLEEAGDRSRRPVATGLRGPVEETHDALDDQQVGPVTPGGGQGREVLLPREPRVE